jgi:hypothetical protein
MYAWSQTIGLARITASDTRTIRFRQNHPWTNNSSRALHSIPPALPMAAVTSSPHSLRHRHCRSLHTHCTPFMCCCPVEAVDKRIAHLEMRATRPRLAPEERGQCQAQAQALRAARDDVAQLATNLAHLAQVGHLQSLRDVVV